MRVECLDMKVLCLDLRVVRLDVRVECLDLRALCLDVKVERLDLKDLRKDECLVPKEVAPSMNLLNEIVSDGHKKNAPHKQCGAPNSSISKF